MMINGPSLRQRSKSWMILRKWNLHQRGVGCQHLMSYFLTGLHSNKKSWNTMDIPDWLSFFPFLDWSGKALSCCSFLIIYASLICQGISSATPWKWNSLVHSTFLSECKLEQCNIKLYCGNSRKQILLNWYSFLCTHRSSQEQIWHGSW